MGPRSGLAGYEGFIAGFFPKANADPYGLLGIYRQTTAVHANCQSHHRCTGPGCIVRTGKTERNAGKRNRKRT